MGKIENVTRKKMAVEKSVEILLKNHVSEAIASYGNRDHAVKAASSVKTLVEKALEKLEEEFKLLKLFITFIWYFCLILKDC